METPIEKKPLDQLHLDIMKFVEQYVARINEVKDVRVVGRIGLDLGFKDKELTKPFSILVFQGGKVKSKLLIDSVNALSELDDKVETMNEEDLNVYLKEYFAKITPFQDKTEN